MKSCRLFLLLIIVVFNFILTTSALHNFYVKPDHSFCPGQPCLTLDQYAEQVDTYFTTGATFIFLAGNHTLKTVINLVNLSDVTLRGEEDASIVCKNRAAFLCKNVGKVSIESLTFIDYSGEDSTILNIINGENIWFRNLTFTRGKDLNGTSQAVYLVHSEIIVSGCVFKGNTAVYGAAIFASNGSNVILNCNIFSENVARSSGGAVFIVGRSNVVLNGNTFIGNRATVSGGALCIFKGVLTIEATLGNTFARNSAVEYGGALFCRQCKVLHHFDDLAFTTHPDPTVCNDTVQQYVLCFANNTAENGGGIFLYLASVSLHGSVIKFIGNSAAYGGGMTIHVSSVVFTTRRLYFIGNNADQSGGAIYSYINSALTLGESLEHRHYFADNKCGLVGGAIMFANGTLNIAGNVSYENNRAFQLGGAMSIINSNAVLSGRVLLIRNQANRGGAVHFDCTDALINGTFITFLHNYAKIIGGGILSTRSKLIFEAEHCYFTSNIAQNGGGGIVSQDNSYLKLTSVNFINNSVNFSTYCGGAMFIANENEVVLHNITFENSINGALCISNSHITLSGSTKFSQNDGDIGGGMLLMNSKALFTGHTLFEENEAVAGGGIGGLYSKVSFSGTTSFKLNRAFEGGAFYASEAEITLSNTINFTSNTARYGGAIVINFVTTLTLLPYTILTTSDNHAVKYGGAIYHEDTVTFSQCNFEHNKTADYLPNCFIHMKNITTADMPFSINSYNDSAEEGSFLFGGLLDRCQIKIFSIELTTIVERKVPYRLFKDEIFHIESADKDLAVSSKPYQLCYCESNTKYNCSRVEKRQLYRGQEFRTSLVALAQGDTITSTLIMAEISSTARLKLNQSTQRLHAGCQVFSYNLYSTRPKERLTLYPESPCHDTGLARAIVDVTFLPCPDAFTQSGGQCVCEERLQVYNADCVIGEKVYIKRETGSRFWMSLSYVNDSYKGLILYKNCPVQYCTNDNTINITLNNLDVQCKGNRSGVLCGACATNYSLMLGGYQCQICSNTYLALLIPFAAAGMALVVFLAFLRLTVATGMINGLILYANIVQVNRNLFLPKDTTNLLTVFVAWLNLDLGFQTCFYNGMDAYSLTWLQFAFPLYIWILISLIILTSRYSILVSKLIGSNPIAVLATLLLMSYTKILKIIIEVYSTVDLDYPDSNKVTVWLKDANVPFLKSKHLLLTVVTLLILAIFFLPYTLFLLLGHKLYRFSSRKHFRWLNRLKPLLDSYYAPYKMHTRYWTGLLLLVRCALYIVFSFNSLGHTTMSLLAINITFTLIGIFSGCFASGRIYTSIYTNFIEVSIYLNLITLSATTLAGANSPALVYTLIGIVFVTTMGVIVYHLHLGYTTKSSMWLKLRARLTTLKEAMKSKVTNRPMYAYTSLSDSNASSSSHDPHRIVTQTVISLREPVMED